MSDSSEGVCEDRYHVDFDVSDGFHELFKVAVGHVEGGWSLGCYWGGDGAVAGVSAATRAGMEMGQRLGMRLLLRLGLLLELRQHVQVSVALFADMDLCSPFGSSGQLFFWQIWVSVVLLADLGLRCSFGSC